jgi:alkylation response protein AidB-like acyl-CoA dehydrogenase
MEFELSDQQIAIQRGVRGFISRECPLEIAQRYDDDAEFPTRLYRAAAGLGLMGLPFDAEYGGVAADEVTESLVVEQLSYAMLPLAVCYVDTVLTSGKVIRDLGSDEQKSRWLPAIASGETIIAHCLSEPTSGWDEGGAQATRTAGGWSISGNRLFCTGADMASMILLIARTGTPDTGSAALSLFLVDPATSGVAIETIRPLGLRPYHACVIDLEQTQVPDGSLIGEVDAAGEYLASNLNRGRIAAAAMRVGTAQVALDHAVRFAQQRKQAHGSVAPSQAIRHRLANAHVAVSLARLLTHRAASLEGTEQSSPLAGSMANIWATDACTKVAGEGIRELGNCADWLDPIQRYLRAALTHPIGAETNETQRDIIAEELQL